MSAKVWGKKKLKGRVYDLSHLNPLLFEAIPGNPDAPRLNVVASFSSHTFTRKRLPEDTPDLHFGENGDPRSFCIERYECSLHLPDLIRGLATGKVDFTHNEKVMKVAQNPACAGEYAAVMRMEKAVANNYGVVARLFVISAHERTNPLAVMEAISFYTLVRKIVAGEPIPWPKKK